MSKKNPFATIKKMDLSALEANQWKLFKLGQPLPTKLRWHRLLNRLRKGKIAQELLKGRYPGGPKIYPPMFAPQRFRFACYSIMTQPTVEGLFQRAYYGTIKARPFISTDDAFLGYDAYGSQVRYNHVYAFIDLEILLRQWPDYMKAAGLQGRIIFDAIRSEVVGESEDAIELGLELLGMGGESPEGVLPSIAREYQQQVQGVQLSDRRPLDVTTDFVRSIQDKNTVIFCGAGVSVNSGLPLARPYMDTVLRELNASEDEIELIRKEPIPFESFIGILQESCSIDLLLDIFDEGEPNVNHMLIANLMVAGKVDLIVTTNFDLLFERALLRKGWVEGKAYDIYYREKDFNSINWHNDRPKLIKIHGSVHDKMGMAITMQQVAGKRYSEPRQIVIDQVFGAGNHKQVLILGYSSSDSFDLLPCIQTVKNQRKKVVIVEHQADSTDSVQIEDIRLRPSNNPFKEYPDSLRVYCNTDHLVRQIWQETLRAPLEGVPATRGDLWRKNVHQWYVEMLEKHSNAAENLIIGRILLDVDKKYAATQRFQHAVNLSQKAGNKGQEAFALALLGAEKNSIPQLEKALAISREIGDKKQEANCLCTLAPKYFSSNQIIKAIQYCEDGLVVARSIDDKQHEGRLLGNLGSLYGSRGQFGKAIEYFEDALRVSHEIGDKAEEGSSLFNIGFAFEKMEKLDKAKEYYMRASKTLGPFLGPTHPVTKQVEGKLTSLRGR